MEIGEGYVLSREFDSWGLGKLVLSVGTLR